MGSEFIGEPFITRVEALGALKLVGAPRVPGSHGAVEVRNRFLRQALRKISGDVGIAPEDLTLILATIENDYNNTNIRTLNGKPTYPSLRVFGYSTSAQRNVFNDTLVSATTSDRRLRTAEEARNIWQQLSTCRKLRDALSRPCKNINYTSFSVGQLVYFYDVSQVDRRWRGPAVVVATNVLYLDNMGVLVHAHYSHVRLASETDFLREDLSNALYNPGTKFTSTEDLISKQVPLINDDSESDLDSVTDTPIDKLESLSKKTTSDFKLPTFQHSFEKELPEHMLGRAGPGARRLTSSNSPSPSSVTQSPREKTSPRNKISPCLGCKNEHRKHSPSCPYSAVQRRQRREHSAPPRLKTTKEPSSTPKLSMKEKLKLKAAEGTPTLGNFFKTRSALSAEVSVENIVEIAVGDHVQYLNECFVKNVGIVQSISDTDILNLEPLLDGPNIEEHVSNVTKVRTIKSNQGEIFGKLPMYSTSTKNADALVQHRQKALAKAALLGESSEIAQFMAGSRDVKASSADFHDLRTSLFTARLAHDLPVGFFDSDDEDGTTCVPSSSESDNEDEYVQIFSVMNLKSKGKANLSSSSSNSKIKIDLKFIDDSNSKPLPKREYIHTHEAADLDFSQLPKEMKATAYEAALEDYDVSKCWEPCGTVREWKAIRRKAQTFPDSNPTITIMDSTWVEKVIVDESLAATKFFGKLKGKVRLAPEDFAKKA
jgi:hypothetical protein